MSLYQFTYSSKLKLLLLLFIIYCFCFYKFINWPPNRISEVDITSDSPSYERINEGSKRQPQKLFAVASVFSVKFSNTPHHSFFKTYPFYLFMIDLSMRTKTRRKRLIFFCLGLSTISGFRGSYFWLFQSLVRANFTIKRLERCSRWIISDIRKSHRKCS